MMDQYIQLDQCRIEKMEYYKYMISPVGNPNQDKLSLPFKIFKCITQIKVTGVPLLDNPLNKNECQLCNKEMGKLEDLFHLCIVCPHYSELRKQKEFLHLQFPVNRYLFKNFFRNVSKDKAMRFWNSFKKFDFRIKHLLELLQ